MVRLIQTSPKYPYMPLELRKNLIPAHSICSIAPAIDPADAFYTGNGRYRLDVFGNPFEETVVVGHELLYEPKWAKTPEPPDLRPYISDIRKAVLDGRPELADRLIEQAQREAGFERYMDMDRSIVYPTESLRTHEALRLRIRRGEERGVHNYIRWLDLYSGVVRSRWESEKGIFETEAVCSFSEDLAAVRISAPEGFLNLDVELVPPPALDLFGKKIFEKCEYRLSRKENCIRLKWAYNPEFGDKGYFAIVRMECSDGTAEYSESGVRIRNASTLSIFLKIIRAEERFSEMDLEAETAQLCSLGLDFDLFAEANDGLLGKKMRQSRFRSGNSEDYYLSGEELLRRCRTDSEIDPVLMSKLFDLGRFYQIIDTGDLPPMWGQHNINTNLQVCAGNSTGLFEEMDCYFRYYESKFDDFRKNAKLLFHARGMLASVHCDYDSGLLYHFSKTYPHYCWTGCLGWIYNEFWGYYLCTGDTEFLKNRIIPALKEIALFFEDYACMRDGRGKTIFVPSFSPENPTPNPGYETVTCKSINPTRINSVMDIAICREVLQNLIEGCEVLGIEQDSVNHWKQQLEDLPDYLTDEEGGLKEWAWEEIEENYNHRHVSHHYDVWPGHRTTPDTEPELCEAIKISNRKRAQQDDSAHGIIHRAFTAIRLKDMEEAEQNLSQLINHGFVRRCLSTAHFPYRGQFPDLQGAVPALTIEMCAASRPGFIEFLPCLPESLSQGSIEGLWLYTRCRLITMSWNKEVIEARLCSLAKQEITLCHRPSHKDLRVNGKSFGESTAAAISLEEAESFTVEIILK